MIIFVIQIILQGIAAFLIGTVVFDICHFFFHRFTESKYKILKKIGSLHLAHHRFYTAHLLINKEMTKNNFSNHILIEFTIQMLIIIACSLFFHPAAILFAILLQVSIFISVCLTRGVDLHHKPYSMLPSYRGGLYVSAEYHALHHIYPTKFFSSYIKVFDYIFGTGHSLKGKRIAITGASGALGSNMRQLLEKEGAIITSFKYGTDYTYQDYSKLAESLTTTDILLLSHGSKFENANQANCDSFIAIIELFKKVRKRELTPVEVWGVGSEIEFHPCFGIKKIKVYAESKRKFAKKAREYFNETDIQYRHIVHSAFSSRMGPGLMTARFAAKWTLFLLKRGFKYVPVSYTGFAYLNYFRFFLNK